MAGQHQLSALNIPPPQRTADTAHDYTRQAELQRRASLLIKDEPALYFNDRRNLHIKILFSVSGCEAEGSFALQHVFVCVFMGGLEWHSNQNAAEGWLTGVVFLV